MTETQAAAPLILTVDDEPEVRASLRAYLEDLDFRVLEAPNGRAGIELIEREAPDLVLVDLRMPEVDGLDVLAYARQLRDELPVIVVSGTGSIADVVEALRLGAADYLVKPIQDLSVLRHTVERTLEHLRLRREQRRHQAALEEAVRVRTAELREANEALRLAAATFEETQQPVIITDRAATIVRVNRAFTEVTGYSAAEALGQNPRLLHSGHQDAEFYQAMWRQILDSGRWQGEIWNRRKDGSVFPQWLSISAVHDEAGAVTHYVGACIDLSALKRQEELIQRAAEEEQVLVALSRLSLQPLAMEGYLQQALDLVSESVAWLGDYDGGIFLADPASPGATPRLVAFRGRDPEELLHYGGLEPAALDAATGCCMEIGREDQRLGRLALLGGDAEPLGEERRDFLHRVADLLGMGILRRNAEAEIEFLAYYDALTALPNRRLFLDRLSLELLAAKRHQAHGALLLVDLDHFKNLNDALGHPVGDLLLTQVAERLRCRLRADDTVARLGGDEFAVLLPRLSDLGERAAFEANLVADNLGGALAEPYDLDGHEHQLSVSVGIAMFPAEGQASTANDILRHADAALYAAKSAGRNAARFYQPEMQVQADNRLRLGKELRQAVEKGQLVLYYQPQLDGADRVIGAETLLRWVHPERGMVPPGEFIPLAEESGLILAVGEWVLREACRQLAEWGKEGPIADGGRLAVNVSPHQFRRPEFVATVEGILRESGADPKRLELEITEGLLVENVEDAGDKMRQLKDLGVGFAVDDFGTGYSSLAYLKSLPLDMLKVDRSFVRDIASDPNDAAIVDAIIAMAARLSLLVTAEGVETEEQRRFLQTRGCHRFQGFLYSRPLPVEGFTAWCAEAISGRLPQAQPAKS